MKSLIILVSIHHQNTKKIADAMAKVLKAKVVGPDEIKDLKGYDLVGFGSGIYGFKHHRSLFALVDRLPEQKGKKIFVFSTSGNGGTGYHNSLVKKLGEKGYNVVGQFGCKGFDTMPYLGFLSKLLIPNGINQGRPNGQDIEDARAFAKKMKKD